MVQNHLNKRHDYLNWDCGLTPLQWTHDLGLTRLITITSQLQLTITRQQESLLTSYPLPSKLAVQWEFDFVHPVLLCFQSSSYKVAGLHSTVMWPWTTIKTYKATVSTLMKTFLCEMSLKGLWFQFWYQKAIFGAKVHTVKPVYNGHSWEMARWLLDAGWPLYTGPLYWTFDCAVNSR